MPTWNEEQLKAIYTKDKNVLVSASAGAGKTTVLIARLVELVINNRIKIDHILAMTFTEAAANEMKKRLAAELHSLYIKSDDEAEKQYISEQLAALPYAHISTIHSFCLSIIQEFYYLSDLSAEAIESVMDEAAMSSAQTSAMEMVMREQYQKQDPVFEQLCAMFSARSEDDEALRNMIRQIAETANSQSNRDQWFSHCRKLCEPKLSLSALPEPILTNFFAYLTTQLDQYTQACQILLQMYETDYSEETKKYETMRKKCECFPQLQELIAGYDYTGFQQAFIACCYLIPPTNPDKSNLLYEQTRKRVINIEDSLIAMLYDEKQLLSDMKDLKEPIDKLIEMSQAYIESYNKIKRLSNGIDFNDMEYYALWLLKYNNGQIAEHYRSLFTEIMVDEFQDSNDIQNDLVSLISRGNNVFRVGDIKQSIYGFRHAKPQLMRGLIDHADPQKDEIIYLSHNYRSKKEIVSFNNKLFWELMNLDGFSCRYAKEDDVNIGIDAQRQGGQPIIFHALDQEALKTESDEIKTANEWKAEYIAAKIVEIKQESNRSWKDFAVLVRANERKKDLKRVFDEWHIPCFIDASSGFYQSNAVQIIVSVLYALADPYDEIHFIAAISSPLFDYDMQSLADIKPVKQEISYYSYMKENHYPKMDIFEQLREMLKHCSICEVLNALYEQANYYTLYTNQQERCNLDLLYDKAIAFESKHPHNLSAFLQQLNELRNTETSEAMPIGNEDDVVRVMSIHQSKGLQFPVVFLWSNSKQSALDFRGLCVCDSELGIALSHVDGDVRLIRKSVQRIAMEHKKNKEELEEEMRILYVATTRAQQQLHIVDCIKDMRSFESILTPAVVYERGGYTSWLLHSALAHNDFALMRTIQVDHLWQKEVQAEVVSIQSDMQYYAGNDPIWHVLSATSEKMPQPKLSLQSKGAMSYGTRLHKYIEALPNRCWNKSDYDTLFPVPSPHELLALQALNENSLYRKANTYREVYHEYPFSVCINHEIIHGFIDFAAIDDDIIIIDFKTDKGIDEKELSKRYREQLLTYTRAMNQLYPDKVIRTYIYSLSLHKEIEITLSVSG